MSGFNVLFKMGMKRRIKDSFLISYGTVFPLFLIGILGYMASNYFSGEDGITSYYYYSVVTIPFCIFLESVTLVYVTREESMYKCGERFIIAPISKAAIVLSKIIPSTISIMIYNFILMGICKFLFKVDYCGKFFHLYILFSIVAFMSCAIGTFVGVSTKDFMQIKNFISTPILIMAMLGGSFFPIGSLGRTIEIISYISPLTWINRGIFLMINDNNIKVYFVAVGITLALGIIFTFGAVKRFRREMFL
ncbi:ABC transporter permease [Clostridium gasigenes]|uniref:Transport permease protein n=1 Tax=Clostridium gasigenes TaxID=94869 RepID=A0A1H0RJH0_9CLOT|nr:ABC transporter permease [Clostridium gasigenes]MBB6715249.1 ABC transporter permease [Clostridium gasigenes]SDP29723.1 ABC-2 type transport system permease protein [Clostridium gasigenes]